jgi:outer membrane protein
MATNRNMLRTLALVLLTPAGLMASTPPDASTLDSLSLAYAVDLALRQNDNIAIGIEELSQSRSDQRLALSSLLPQISANAQFTRIDRDRATASFGSAPLESTTAGFTISQAIFNDPAITDFRVSRRQTEISQYKLDRTRIEVTYAAASAFISWVSALAVHEIEQDNLELTQRNLELAQARREAGSAGPEEVYRWQTEIAVRRSAVNSAKSNVAKALAQLNRTIKSPLRAQWTPNRPTLETDRYEFLGKRILDLLDRKPGYDGFIELCRKTMLEKAPEIKVLDLAIEAQQLSIAQLERQFFVPAVALQFNYDYTLEENLEGDDIDFGGGTDFDFNGGDDEDWSLALRADFPLFEGGGRFAELGGAKSELRRLAALKSQTLDVLEESLLKAIYAVGSSHPNINLTRSAADTAKQNLRVVQDKYANGKASILDLIDAQNQSLVQEQAAVIAVYEFMQNMLDVQRAMAWFEMTAATDEVQTWLTELENRIHIQP